MPKVRGPKDGNVITASFDGKEKSLFPSLKSTKDLVLLSIRGNEYCVGDYLGAIVQQAVATHQTPFNYSGAKGKTTFLIADEIYWHNIKELTSTESEVETLKKDAIKIGDNYFLTNLGAFLTPLNMTTEEFNRKHPNKSADELITIINQLANEQGKNFEVVRWQAWVAQNQSQEIINKIMGFYESVDGLRESINTAKEDFVKRHGKDDNQALWSRRSQDYLTEESPAVMWLAASLGYNFVVYPGEILAPFEATKEFFVVPKHVAYISQGKNINDECGHNEYCIHVDDPSRLVNWLEVNFKRSHPPKASAISAEQHTTPVETLASIDKKMNFFSSTRNKSKVSVLAEKDKEHVKDDTVITNQNALIIASVVDGLSKALATSSMNDKKTGKSASILSDTFAGVTRGVLAATELSQSEKVDFLVNVINGVLQASHPNSYIPSGSSSDSMFLEYSCGSSLR